MYASGVLKTCVSSSQEFRFQQSILSKNSEMHQRFVHKNDHHSKFVTENPEKSLNYEKASKNNSDHIMEKYTSIKIDVYK